MLMQMESIEDEERVHDPFPLVFFWARRVAKNGNKEANVFLERIVSLAHSKGRYCGKPDPQMTCSQCHGASYCDKTCQKMAWKSGHQVVCNGLPKLNTLSEDECAQCGKDMSGFM